MLPASGILVLLAGCQPAAPPRAASEPAVPPPPPPTMKFLWQTEAQAEAARAFLAATDSAPAKAAFLRAYRNGVAGLKQTEGASAVPVLRRLWEMNRVTLAAKLPASEVRAAVGLAEAKAPPTYHPKARLDQPVKGWDLATPAAYDPEVWKILRGTKLSSGGSYAEFVAKWLRYVVVVAEKSLLDPELPLTCEGIADPLVGTAFITEIHPITSQKRPPWKRAAALVHEAEHVRWFYEKAGEDPRLLFVVPDERNALIRMVTFLEAVRAGEQAGSESGVIAQEAREWLALVANANTALGYPAGDRSVRTDLDVSDEVLMTDPGCPVPGSGRGPGKGDG